MAKYGFKELTLENWLEPDQAMRHFGKLAANDRIERLSGDYWLKLF